MNFLSKRILGVISIVSIFAMLQGCGGDGSNSGSCCQGEAETLSKISEVDKVVSVPEVKGNQIIYVDRNVTVIQYVDRNVTIIKYVDRNVTVDVVKVKPKAHITGLNDGAVLTGGNTLVLDSVNSSDVDGNVTKYRWILDDANISTEKSPIIDLPTLEGTYKLCLEVTDNDNLISDIVCKTFVIPAEVIPAENQEPTSIMNGLNVDGKVIKTKCPIQVSGMNSIAYNSDITSYIWTVDGNQTLNGKDQNLSFDTNGTHEVCLEVMDSNDLNNTQCSSVEVKKHVSPTPIITTKDDMGNLFTSGALNRGKKYHFSCADSIDDCGNKEPMTCKWSAHSFRIVNNKRVDYEPDCMTHNGSPKEGKETWVKLCSRGSSPISKYRYIEVILEITDRFGNAAIKTGFFEVAP